MPNLLCTVSRMIGNSRSPRFVVECCGLPVAGRIECRSPISLAGFYNVRRTVGVLDIERRIHWSKTSIDPAGIVRLGVEDHANGKHVLAIAKLRAHIRVRIRLPRQL